jgi:hypothetical protein
MNAIEAAADKKTNMYNNQASRQSFTNLNLIIKCFLGKKQRVEYQFRVLDFIGVAS